MPSFARYDRAGLRLSVVFCPFATGRPTPAGPGAAPQAAAATRAATATPPAPAPAHAGASSGGRHPPAPAAPPATTATSSSEEDRNEDRPPGSEPRAPGGSRGSPRTRPARRGRRDAATAPRPPEAAAGPRAADRPSTPRPDRGRLLGRGDAGPPGAPRHAAARAGHVRGIPHPHSQLKLLYYKDLFIVTGPRIEGRWSGGRGTPLAAAPGVLCHCVMA